MKWRLTLAHQVGDKINFSYQGLSYEGVVKDVTMRVNEFCAIIRYRLATDKGKDFSIIKTFRKV